MKRTPRARSGDVLRRPSRARQSLSQRRQSTTALRTKVRVVCQNRCIMVAHARPTIAVFLAMAPIAGFVACETKPPTIQRDRECPSVASASVGVGPAHPGKHTTHHVCAGLRDDANRTLGSAVEAANSRCSTVDDCVPLPVPSDCGLAWGTCVPKLVSRSERHAFEVIDDLRAHACASWTKIGCNDYVDDPPACSISATPICAKGTCSVEVTYPSASSSWP